MFSAGMVSIVVVSTSVMSRPSECFLSPTKEVIFIPAVVVLVPRRIRIIIRLAMRLRLRFFHVCCRFLTRR